MRVRLLIPLAVLGVLLAVIPGVRAETATPAGSIGIRIVDAPTDRANDPRARLYVVDHLAPGTTITRRVEVSNGTTGSLKIPVYAAAATVEANEFRFGEDRATNELTSWTTIAPEQVNVAAKGVAIATVTIAVPSNASAGERYAVVWAQSPTATPAGGGISSVNRVGVRVYLSVGPGGEPPSDFEITALQPRRAPSGEPVVTAIVKNIGGRALDLSGELRLSKGPAGLAAGPFPATIGGTLAIGASEPILVKLDKAVPAGPWLAEITLKSGITERSASATLTFPKAGAGQAVDTKPASKSKVPVAVGAGVAAVSLIALGRLAIRRFPRRASTDT